MTEPRREISSAWLYAMFFGSGAASLILQVVWFKQLRFILGSSTAAVTVTIASFFMGLSLGAFLGGRRADQTKRPLVAYAGIEGALGVLSALITWVLSQWAGWVPPLLPFLSPESALHVPAMIAVGTVVLILPTVLMGSTLPFLVRFVTHRTDELARRVGVLYGINTLGAATGCWVVGYILLENLGVLRSALVASVLYLAIAAAAWVLSRQGESAPPSAGVEAESSAPVESRDRLLIGVFALSGFASIAYEVIWFRMLTIVSPQSVYTFSGILSVYLLGLVAGSFICARFVAPVKELLLPRFARVQLLVGMTALLSLGMMGKISTLSDYVSAAMVAVGLPLELKTYVLCVLIFTLPTTLIGISFPLASELVVHRLGVVGRKLGLIYALNTLGGVLGSLCAGFLLLPLVGSQWALVIMAALNFALAAAVAWGTSARESTVRRETLVAGVAAVAMVGALGTDYLAKQLTAYDNAKVAELRETKDATFVVLEYGEGEERFVQLLANGTSYANNAPTGRRYMSALAHLPTLLHRDPHSAVIVCIGTGTTVGALSTYSQLEDIHAVDLSPEVFEFAPHFVPVNESFHENPRVRQVAADGRHYLLAHDTKYDVLTFEPPPPDDAGIVNLYSEEFYDVARSRMSDGAILAQWVPMNVVRGDVPKALIVALLAKFKHVSLWVPNRMEGIAIASDEPLQLDEAELSRRMKETRVQASLKPVGLDTFEDFAGTFFAADEELARWVEGVPTVTDDRPTIEYHRSFPLGAIEFSDLESLHTDVEKHMTAPPSDPAALRDAKQAVIEVNAAHKAPTHAERLEHARRAAALRPDNDFMKWKLRAVEAE